MGGEKREDRNVTTVRRRFSSLDSEDDSGCGKRVLGLTVLAGLVVWGD